MKKIQRSPYIRLCLGSIEMYCVISESCYKGTILQRNYMQLAILFVKFHGKNRECSAVLECLTKD